MDEADSVDRRDGPRSNHRQTDWSTLSHTVIPETDGSTRFATVDRERSIGARALEPRLVHEALVYSSDEAFLARLIPFLREGVEDGQPPIVVVAPEKVALLREALGDDADRISFAEPSTLYRSPAYAIAEYRRRLDEEMSGREGELLRVVGEVPFGSTAEEHARWTRYESVFNRGLAAYPTWVVCGYDARALPEQVVADALRTHPLVSTGGAPDASSGYAGGGDPVQRPVRRG